MEAELAQRVAALSKVGCLSLGARAGTWSWMVLGSRALVTVVPRVGVSEPRKELGAVSRALLSEVACFFSVSSRPGFRSPCVDFPRFVRCVLHWFRRARSDAHCCSGGFESIPQSSRHELWLKQGSGRLAGSAARACASRSRCCQGKPHVGRRDYFKKKGSIFPRKMEILFSFEGDPNKYIIPNSLTHSRV